jgi:hypothetical protein
MVRWNAPFEIEEVKQLTLIAALPTHHDPPPPPNESRERESWRANNHIRQAEKHVRFVPEPELDLKNREE